jgi:hypothetical protein
MPNLPAILMGPNKPKTDLTPMDVYIHGVEESEFDAIAQRSQARTEQAAQMPKIFEILKSEAGERGFHVPWPPGKEFHKHKWSPAQPRLSESRNFTRTPKRSSNIVC